MEISTLMVGWGWNYEQLRAGWQEIEELGYDACYMGDDLFPHYFDDDPANAQARVEVYDPWTVLPAMAETTRRMRIGPLVSPCGRRHPALFAKITTLVDIISEGRLTVSMGAGNAPDQTRAVGEPYLSGTERADKLEEEVRILNSLWTEERTSFVGKYYSVSNLVNFPKPVRRSGPELQIAFKSKKYLTRLAAEFADRVNLLGTDDEKVVEAMDALKTHCEDLGRNYDEIKKGRLSAILFTESEIGSGELDHVLEERAAQINYDPDELKREHKGFVLSYVGPVSACAAALRKRTVDIGVTELVICPDTIGENSYERTMEGLRMFARQVMPQLKAL